MALDRQLSRDFWLSEFSGWELATEEQVAKLARTVALVLQPIRTAFGVPVRPTSWIAWSSGALRDGAHAEGGTVDFIVDEGQTRAAHDWAARFLVPGGYIGRLIYEPTRPAHGTTPRQGEHVHMAPRDDMVAAYGPAEADVQVLEELAEGEYTFARVGLAAGTGALALAALAFFRCALEGASARMVTRQKEASPAPIDTTSTAEAGGVAALRLAGLCAPVPRFAGPFFGRSFGRGPGRAPRTRKPPDP